MTRLDEILKRCEAATAGPWRFGLDTPSRGYLHANKIILADNVYMKEGEFISRARTDLPLVVAALQKAVKALTDIDHEMGLSSEHCGGTTGEKYKFALYVVYELRDRAAKTLAEIEKLLGESK